MEKEKEQSAWDLWSGIYPWMIGDFIKFKTFEEFKQEVFKPVAKYSNKTLEEIDVEMAQVVAAYEKNK